MVDPGPQPIEAEWDVSAYSSTGTRVGPERIVTLSTSPALLPKGSQRFPGSPAAALAQNKAKAAKKAAT